jgi:hypothetical protein
VYAPKEIDNQSIQPYFFALLVLSFTSFQFIVALAALCCFEEKSIRVNLTRQGFIPFHVSYQVFMRTSTPLLAMARDGDHNKHPRGEGPSHDGRQLPSHRARNDTSPDWASSSTMLGFIPHWQLLGLSSCRGVDHRLFVGVGLLFQVRWQHRRWL